MPRSMLAAVGGLAVAVLLGVLGLNAETTNKGLAVALLTCAFAVSGLIALALLIAHLRTPSTGRVALEGVRLDPVPADRARDDAAAPPSSVDGPGAGDSAPAHDPAPHEGVSVLQPVGLLAAVEGILEDASAAPSGAAVASLDQAEPAGHARAAPRPELTASRVAIGRRVAVRPGSGEKALLARSALLDALQELHRDELVAAADSHPEAAPEARG